MSEKTKSFSVSGSHNGRTYSDYYSFRFVKITGWLSDYWEIHSTSRPRDPWGKGVLDTHVYPNSKICVSKGFEPKTFDKAVAIAEFWAHGFSRYVRDGGVVFNGAARVDV